MVAANATANQSVFANSFYVSSDYPNPIPSGSIFAVTQNQRIANTAQLATTSLQSGNNATAIAALQTTQGTQGTSITGLQTLTTTQGTNVTALQTLTTLHAAEIAANNNSQMDFNTQLLGVVNTSLTGLSTSSAYFATQLGVTNAALSGLSSSSGSGPLPYYANDSAARAAGLK